MYDDIYSNNVHKQNAAVQLFRQLLVVRERKIEDQNNSLPVGINWTHALSIHIQTDSAGNRT